jgi:hypothetical protein
MDTEADNKQPETPSFIEVAEEAIRKLKIINQLSNLGLITSRKHRELVDQIRRDIGVLSPD